MPTTPHADLTRPRAGVELLRTTCVIIGAAVRLVRPPTIESTDALAARAHAGQKDKSGNTYIEHPRRVAARVRHHGPDVVMAALLHDTVEDTGLTLNRLLLRGYRPVVVGAVDSCTRRMQESYMDLVNRAAADLVGRVVKLADNLDNSDEQRLALLVADEAERLRRKYRRARKVLDPQNAGL